VTAVLVEAARALEAGGAEALMICSNTIHMMAPDVTAAVRIPLIHVADATARAIRARRARRPLLLATRFTMEEAFYVDRLRALDVDPVIPDADERAELHRIIFDELVQGRFEESSRRTVIAATRRAVETAGADSVILGCTEFGLLVGPADFSIPMFDTTEIHARAGMNFALADEVSLRLATAADAADIAELYLASRADALPFVRSPHSDDEIRAWVPQVLLPRSETWVAVARNVIVGFLAREGEDLDQLYLLPGWYRHGIGSRLLAKAKARSPGGLHLYTFQRNTRARAFYEKHGFVIDNMNDGSRNEENEPDIHYIWRGEP
jgi:aspartate racemase